MDENKVIWEFGDVDGKCAVISVQTNGVKSIHIPKASPKGNPVVMIGERLVGANGSDIEEIFVPDGIQYIGDLAFRGCSNLRLVHLPKKMVRIGYGAFLNCDLRILAIPEAHILETGCFGGNKSGVFYLDGNVDVIQAYAFKDSNTVVFANPKMALARFDSKWSYGLAKEPHLATKNEQDALFAYLTYDSGQNTLKDDVLEDINELLGLNESEPPKESEKIETPKLEEKIQEETHMEKENVEQINENKEQNESIRQLAAQHDELQLLVDSLKKEADQASENITLRKTEILANAENEAKTLKSDAEAISTKIKSEAEKYGKDTRKLADKTYDDKLKEAEKAAEKMLADAEAKNQLLLAENARVKATLESQKKALDELQKRLDDKDKELQEREQAIIAQRSKVIINTIEKRQKECDDVNQRIRDKEDEFTRLVASQSKELEKEYASKKSKLEDEIATLEKKKERLATERERLQNGIEENERKEKMLNEERDRLNRNKERFNEAVEARVKERYGASLDSVNEKAKVNEEHYREQLSRYNELYRKYVDLKEASKNSEALELAELQTELSEANQEIKRKQAELEDLEKQLLDDGDKEELRILRGKVKGISDIKEANNKLLEENAKYREKENLFFDQTEIINQEKSMGEIYKTLIAKLQEELKNRSMPSREERLSPLRTTVRAIEDARKVRESFDDKTSEMDWLKYVMDQTEKSNIILKPRIFYAYHTSLKIHEWSPLVVLAGVSGTGKSELPRQYATHGGMVFLPVAVKPDWDSPQSLFGFYNSIENRLQPTDLLKVLYNVQMGRSDIRGLDGRMTMILLDEMNLAHVELYFSDMLSKFETARGTREAPRYSVDLGVGEKAEDCAPEEISIGNNVLWTGTMNEDETTKALSDKVVDRSMTISFPRPKELISRPNNHNEEQVMYLKYSTWKKWVDESLKTSQLDSDTMKEFKDIITELNGLISKMGRNLGHRVWQGIENYIAAHPLVNDQYRHAGCWDEKGKKKMKSAFVEAVVFKVMPKLRGLETQGSFSTTFDEISALFGRYPYLAELKTDFDDSRYLDSQIFQWASSSFFDKDF